MVDGHLCPKYLYNSFPVFFYRFSEAFDGVLLAYDVNILDKCAKILPGVHPYFGVRLKAKLLLFSPKPDLLIGKFSIIFCLF